MPRRPRVLLPGVPLHVIQRGNNRTACFYAEDDYRFYLEWLEKYALDHDCRIHAYVLMTNHVHLLLSFERGDAPGALMKALGQRYVQYVNRTYRRSGTLWEGRFRSALIQAEPYLLLCQNNRGQTTVFAVLFYRFFQGLTMPRRPRVVLPGVPLHVIQRGNNRTACFFAEDDYRFYLEWLEKYAADHDCRIHAYVLMTNHVHLLLSFERGDAPGALMKALGQRYVQYVNRTYRRSGTLWEGRFRSALIQAEPYLLLCQRYIELNPVRARMVEHPADYPWSSYQCNALGVDNPLVSPHALYCSLGGEAKERLSAYRELFRFELEPGAVDQLRAVTNGNFALGDERFSAQVAEALGRRVTPGVSGRPRRKAETDDGLALT